MDDDGLPSLVWGWVTDRDHWFRDVVALLAFGVTVGTISQLPDGAQAPRWALMSLAPLIAFMYCWKWRAGREHAPWAIGAGGLSLPQGKSAGPSPLAYIALAYMAGSLAWSPDPVAGSDLWWHFAVLITVAAIAPADMSKVFWAIGIGLCINSVIVMMQLEGMDPVEHVRPMQSTGLFFNRNQQNAFAAMALIGLVSLKDWRAYLLAIVASLPLLTPPIARGPLLALGCAGLFVVCRRWKVFIPAAIVAVAGALLWLANDPIRISALLERAETWGSALAGLTWLGRGLGSFQWQFSEMEYAHNDLLQIAYELGIPGFFCVASVMLYCLKSGPLVPRLILIVFAVEGLFDFPLYQPAAAFLAALAAGHLVRDRAPVCGAVSDREWIRGLRQAPS